MTEQYNTWAGWQALLRGEKINVSADDPYQGYYRMRSEKGGPFVPVAYWYEGDNLFCLINGKLQDEQRARERWTYCVQHPITHETYLAVTERGENWPDMDETVASQMKPPAPGGIGHNSGAEDEAALLQEQIESAKAGASAYAKITDDETQAKAQSLRARLNELAGQADKHRDALKRPHLDAGKAIDAKWQPIIKLAKGAADAIAAAMSVWETEKARVAREAEAKRQEAIRKQEEEARKAAEAGKPAPKPAPLPPAPAPVSSSPVKGAYGRAASVKIVKVASVVDQDKVYAFMRDRPEVKDLLASLAQRAVTAGHDVPGVTVEEIRKVA